MAKANGEEVYETNVLLNLSLLSERLNDTPSALTYLEQATTLDPHNIKLSQRLQSLRHQVLNRQATSYFPV